MTDDLERRLWAIESGRDPALGFTCWYRNPDGPEAADEIARLRAENEALQAENFKLAAGACNVEGGLIGDDHGHLDCSLKARIEALERELAEARSAMVKVRSDIFGRLRHHDVSEQCFAEVAMITQAAIRNGERG